MLGVQPKFKSCLYFLGWVILCGTIPHQTCQPALPILSLEHTLCIPTALYVLSLDDCRLSSLPPLIPQSDPFSTSLIEWSSKSINHLLSLLWFKSLQQISIYFRTKSKHFPSSQRLWVHILVTTLTSSFNSISFIKV